MAFAALKETVVPVIAGLAALFLATCPAQAQHEVVLHSFTYNDGSTPSAGLTPDGAGNFYGTASYGGANNCCGVVFRLSPDGSGGWSETIIHDFTNMPDGATPVGPVIFDSAGNLYGATLGGGANNKGAVFELSPAGETWTEKVLYSFTDQGDGEYPETGLIRDSAGNLYGSGIHGVFELSSSEGAWASKTIYSTTPGQNFIADGLTMDGAGNVFGVTSSHVFELSPNGKGGWRLKIIHVFAGSPNDGAYAQGTPVFDKNGNLFGTTSGGGLGNNTGNGTVYELSPAPDGSWTEKILYFFPGGASGLDPFSGVVLDAAGNLYGTTVGGGKAGDGTVFELMAPRGTGSYKYRTLLSFNGGAGGANPHGTLFLDSKGDLYSTAIGGGSTEGPCGGMRGCGVAFEITR
jgi:uncharacterized repeat protein (TIGR03803 family)